MSVSDTLSRADSLLRRRVEREEAQLEREDAENMMAARERSRDDTYRRHEIGARYADSFAAYGEKTPAPVADETPGQYRARLYETLRLKLPEGSEWANVRADSVPASARSQIESFVIAAAQREGLTPSRDSLPRDGSMVMRTRIDENTGAKELHWHGRESFVKQMGQPGRRVVRLMNPKTGAILMGEPMPRAEMVGHFSPY